ncbi:MAG: GNAT family N-acetyltransferase [Terriglobales bacterium]
MSVVTQAYESIFLQPGWVHEAYYGWSMLAFEPGRLKLLRKCRAAVSQNLLLASGVEDGELAKIATSHGLLKATSITTLHDFGAKADERRTLGERHFLLLRSGERMLNVATYVIDLAASQEELWERLGSKSRNMVRRAEAAGMRFTISRMGDANLLTKFFQLHASVAARNQFRPANKPAIQRMRQDGRLLIAACSAADGAVLTVNLIYTSGDSAYFLLGASVDELPPGCGQLMHWQTSLDLKRAGLRWYDLGGVPPDPSHGIHRFKASLGGSFCDLGREFRYTPTALASVYGWYRKLRR